jgi:hypothetical protein
MSQRTHRLRFKIVSALLLLSGAATSMGCDRDSTGEEGPVGKQSVSETPLSATDFVELGAGVVGIVAPPAGRLAAYLSMGERRVHVTYEDRDPSAWMFDAHISVSTGLWRIPLPGDPPSRPIAPDDHEREFEEVRLRLDELPEEPSIGDVRLVRGGVVERRLRADCTGDVGVFLEGEWSLARGEPGGEDSLVREEFRLVGEGTLHREPLCGRAGEATAVAAWVAVAGPAGG